MIDVPDDPKTHHGGREILSKPHSDQKSCTCDDWTPRLKSLTISLLEIFIFCPWCGSSLTTTSVSNLDLPTE